MGPTRTDGADPVVRKAQLTGGSTFTVSLPKGWADRQGLESGTELWLYALEDRVVVAPTATANGRQSVTIDVDDLGDDALARRLRAAYTAGSDSIAVTAENGLSDERRRLARRTLSGLVGLEVDRRAENRIEARSLLDAGEVSLQQTIAQLHGVVTNMHRDAAEAVATGDEVLASTVQRRTTDLDRLAALVTRQFAGALVDVAAVERLETDRKTAYRHERTADSLQRLGREAARITALGKQLDCSVPVPVGEALRESATALATVLGTALDGAPPTEESGRDELRAGLAAVEAAVETTIDAPAAADAIVYGRLLERYRKCAATADTIAATMAEADLLADYGD